MNEELNSFLPVMLSDGTPFLYTVPSTQYPDSGTPDSVHQTQYPVLSTPYSARYSARYSVACQSFTAGT
jgi:hypothetical protein